jgi:large subunit ribosomal protein L23
MKDIFSVLKRPLITEKSTQMKESMRTVAFQVDRSATKNEIKRAVETLFKVKVESVRTSNFHGKKKRMGRHEGRRADWKKAYVTLKEGEKMIEVFEGV